MDVEIITIGDELLIGQVVDTNSSWMGKILNDNGFRIVRKAVVGDIGADIANAVEDAMKRVPIVMLTGGLGPTRDDITLNTLCRYFGCKLHFSDAVYANIEQIFRSSGRTMNELTRRQAMVPEGALILRNRAGTAPCTCFERDGRMLISMPGVPAEMRWLMENEVIPLLKRRFARDITVAHRTCSVAGYTESALAIKLSAFEDKLPPFVKLAYLPDAGIIRLRITVQHQDATQAVTAAEELKAELGDILGDSIIAFEDKRIEVLVGEQLRAAGLTVGTAESCTGGAVAAALTSVAGSSDYFKGGVVAYSNAVKTALLGVSVNDLSVHGAVSREVAEQMALGALDALGCNCAVATSGIAGPGGGSDEKPVGTVWIAVANAAAGRKRVISQKYLFSTVREINIRRAVNMALLMLYNELRPDYGNNS